MVGICRLCAALRKRDVLTTFTDTNHVVCRKLQECCQIQIRLDDTLPKCICGECIEALQQAHSFYIKVHESQESLATLFPPVARVSDDKTLNTAKPLTLAESLAPAIHLTANNEKVAKVSPHMECVVASGQLKTEVHVTEVMENSEECETHMILDEHEVNLMLDKVEEEIDDEVYLIEKILGRKCGEEDEDEFICDVRLTAINQSSAGNKAQNSAESHNNSDAEEQPSEPARSAATSEKYVDIESEHVKSGDEEAVEEELEEVLETIEEVYEEDIVLQENQEQKEAQTQEEELSMQLQPSKHADDEIQLDTWNAYSWLCCLCSAAETSFGDLLTHWQDTHDLQTWSDIQFKCVDCQKICPRYYSFLNHVRFRHRAPLTLCCDVCNLICADFKHLARHRYMKHAHDNDFPLVYLCGDCGHGFKDQNSLQIHSKIHAKNGKKFECTHCGKSFTRQLAWKTHQTLHTEIKEFSCEQCGKSFRQKINLLSHILTHVGDRPYECSVCQKNFKTPTSLEKHLITHTDIKNFKCDYCDNTFRTKDSKVSHERTHTGERPYKCKYCERSYRFRSTLISHENTHTGNRPYSCEPCNHHFTNWSNYNKHMKRRHGTKNDSKKGRRTAKPNNATDASTRFTYEVLDEAVDSPDSVLHEGVTYAVSTENVDTNTSGIIEITTLSASNSESGKIEEHM